jgi:hypothetical protein
MGHAHVKRLERYGALVGRLAESLIEDALTLNPARRLFTAIVAVRRGHPVEHGHGHVACAVVLGLALGTRSQAAAA